MQLKSHMHVASRTALAAVIPGRERRKIFSIGFNKTGSTSLHDLFKTLGYLSYHGTAWRKTSRLWIYYGYDAFCDGVPDDFAKLDRMFPGSKFILQVRNLDEWIDSRLDHIRREPNKDRKDFDDDWNMSDEAVYSWVRKRNIYHASVLRHFAERPGDCLTLNYIRDPEAADKICQHLGHAPLGAKPHSNANPDAERTLRHKDQIERCLRDMGIPEDEWSKDLLSSTLPADVDITGLPRDTAERS